MQKLFIWFAVLGLPLLFGNARADWYSDAINNSPESCPASCRLHHEIITESNPENLHCFRPLNFWHYNSTAGRCEYLNKIACEFESNPNTYESRRKCYENCHQCRNQDFSTSQEPAKPTCECRYFENKGCKVVHFAPPGHRCECSLESWRWKCSARAVPCVNPTSCPGKPQGQRYTGYNDVSRIVYPWDMPGKFDPFEKIEKELHAKSVIFENYRACMVQKGVPSNLMLNPDVQMNDYNNANKQWNQRIRQKWPRGYVLPRISEDVAAAVSCGVKMGIKTIPNSGAGSYESLSFGDEGAIIIDFRNMKKMSVNPSDSTATIEPGALVGPINAYLWDNGKYFLPMGNCLTVGIGGHAVGGGMGFFAGVYGLAVDSILEMTVVDAGGNIQLVNKDTNPDLFWAMRGVGTGYFGIVTKFKFRVYRADQMKLTFVKIKYPVADFAKVFDAYQKLSQWEEETKAGAFSSIFITNDKKDAKIPPIDPGIDVQVIHIQEPNLQPKDSSALLAKLREIFPPNGNFIIQNPSYIQLVVETGYAPVVIPPPRATRSTTLSSKYVTIARLNDPVFNVGTTPGGGRPTPGDGGPGSDYPPYLNMLTKDIALPRYFKAKSFYVKKYLNEKEMFDLGSVMNYIPQNNNWVMISSQRGAISAKPASESAFVHRNNLFDIVVHHEGTNADADVKAGKTFMYFMWEHVQSLDSGESYQNYVDLEVPDYLNRFYGSDLDRLKTVKKQWDASDYFKNERSIPIN